jgi:hypothetical protein
MVTCGLTEPTRESLQVPGQTPETAHGPQSLDSKATQTRQIPALSLPNRDLASGRTIYVRSRRGPLLVSMEHMRHPSNVNKAHEHMVWCFLRVTLHSYCNSGNKQFMLRKSEKCRV